MRRFKEFSTNELIQLRNSLDLAGFSTLCDEVIEELKLRGKIE